MTNGDQRRGKKKYRVRYDRIVVFALLIALIAVVASSCCKAIFKSDVDTENENSSSSSDNSDPKEDSEEPTAAEYPTEEPTEATTSAPLTTDIELDAEASLKGDLILVNTDYEYTFPSGDIEPVDVYLNRNDCYQAGDCVSELDKNVIIHLNDLMTAYAAAMGMTSTDVFVIDGYRTYDDQAYRHSSGTSNTFEAGHSDYHTGRTIDFFRYDSMSATGYSYFEADSWFNENCGNYGFIIRYPENKKEITGENPRSYTYRYVGVPHAAYINSKGICLEEYIAEVQKHTIDAPLSIEAGGHAYEVYYVSANANGKTTAAVPTDKTYTVSGDNAGGFIITVALS